MTAPALSADRQGQHVVPSHVKAGPGSGVDSTMVQRRESGASVGEEPAVRGRMRNKTEDRRTMRVCDLLEPVNGSA